MGELNKVSERAQSHAINGESINFKNLPQHMSQYIVDQNYEHYSPIDQALWRYVMRINKAYFKNFAHSSYLEGLEACGISIDRIPRIEEMNATLEKIGWAACCVDGFIPSNSFMEFQALKILPMAAEIRNLDHIEYTPSPDFIHEAAGHAPIIADPEYADYLKLFGEVGSKSIFYPEDHKLYEAIRHLSIVKENEADNTEKIIEAEKEVKRIFNSINDPSEANLLMRLHWWTVEYGLVGDINDHKIYGAGLLSSIGESQECLKDHVIKIPLSIDCIHTAFDITEPQPQLFVTPDFSTILSVLEEFKASMAHITGGKRAIDKAIKSKSLATFDFKNGLQVSGIFDNVTCDDNGDCVLLEGSSFLVLSTDNKEVHRFHSDPFSEQFAFPIGTLTNPEVFSDSSKGSDIVLKYAEGHEVSGKIKDLFKVDDKVVGLSLSDCFFNLNGHSDFKGGINIPIADFVTSAYPGPADKESFSKELYISEESALRASNNSNPELEELYQIVRDTREGNANSKNLDFVLEKIDQFPKEWLLRVEIYELIHDKASTLEEKIKLKQELEELMSEPKLHKLVKNGIELIKGSANF